jgi:hypothetical protein
VGLNINYYNIPGLPKLAWLATLNMNTFAELYVYHGSSVECRKTWVVEGVWDGDFLLQKIFIRTFWPQIKTRRSTTFWPNLDVSFLMWIWVAHLLSERMGRELHNCVEVLSDAKEKLGLEAIHRGVSMRMKLPLYN